MYIGSPETKGIGSFEPLIVSLRNKLTFSARIVHDLNNLSISSSPVVSIFKYAVEHLSLDRPTHILFYQIRDCFPWDVEAMKFFPPLLYQF